MKRPKIVLVTPWNLSKKPHQRVKKEVDLLIELGFIVHVVYPEISKIFFRENELVKKVQYILQNETIKYIICYDLLPLSFMKMKLDLETTTLIAEIIDDFPSYYAQRLNKLPLYGRRLLQLILDLFEKKILFNTEKIIVNSNFLFEKISAYHSQVAYVPYTSPFEGEFINKPSDNISLIYLGSFSKQKGANRMLNFFFTLRNDLPNKNIRLYIFGDNYYKKVDHNDIYFFKRLDKNELLKNIKHISSNSFLIGLSFIQSSFRSYAKQEANKDIDYLSMGIPIIGNYREPTADLIRLGGGVFFDNKNTVAQLCISKNFQQKLIMDSLSLYNDRYQNAKIKARYREIFLQ